MNKNLLIKIGKILCLILISLYILFLIVPFIFNIFIDRYTPQLVGEINKATGLNSGIEELKIITSPKLTAGLKFKKFELYSPYKENIIIADNFELKFSLISFITKNIKIDVIKLGNADITLKFNKDNELEFLKYIPKQNNSINENKENSEPNYLPFGLKLSNNLPDIRVNTFKINITDGSNNYILYGDKTDITDFIINKSIKINTSGKIKLKDKEQFKYKVYLNNTIMPDIELNELLFDNNKQEEKTESAALDIISILNRLYANNATANIEINLKSSKDSINGYIKADNVSVIDLPASNALFEFKDNTIKMNSDIYTAKDEISVLSGTLVTGKKTNADFQFKTDVDLANLINIIKKAALIFDVQDLQTLTAKGRIKADFNIKSDLKTLSSSGYLNIPYANIYYGLYKIGIDNINADIRMDNNNINIKNAGFSVLNQPLKLYGTVNSDSEADIHIITDKLNLKGLLIALGQASLMKENPISSGTISLNAYIKGKLDRINPVIKLNIENVNLKNIPSDLILKAPYSEVNITSEGNQFRGNAEALNIKLINPAAIIDIPKVNAKILPEEIEFLQTPVKIEKIKTNISGKISNYLTSHIGINFDTNGDIKSNLKGTINTAKQTLDLIYSTTEGSKIIIPMFDKSQLTFKGKLNISGNIINPVISGNVTVPSVIIPEIPVKMSDMDLKINGTFLHGSGSVRTFESGGIKAQNLTGDFELKGMDFYLKNLKGNAFNGKIKGNILYNLSNANTKISFTGTGLDAESAIEGGSGIKNALSGILDFDTVLTMKVTEYNQMLKSMKGDLSFKIKNGAFGTIGRFEGFLGAANITQNYFLKNTVNALSDAAGLATAAQFDTLEGKITFADGIANLNPVKSTGKNLCYYITGKYNLINGTTNVIILGRLDAPIVAKLGMLGTLEMKNIIGDTAANILKILTSNPQNEKTENIPQLSNGSQNYQDFKVLFNGGVDSKISVKMFKWLKNADLTNYEKQTAKNVINTVKEAYKTDIEKTKEEINNSVETKKKEIENVKSQINTTKEDFKNLWKSIKTNEKMNQNTAPSADSAQTTVPQSESKPAEEPVKTSESNQPVNNENNSAASVQNETN